MCDVKDEHELLTVREAAYFLRVHPDTLRQWVRKGAIGHIRIGPAPGRIRIERTMIDDDRRRSTMSRK